MGGETWHTAGEAIAESYYRQSRVRSRSPRSRTQGHGAGSAERFCVDAMAELEFSFGRTKAAREALKGLSLTPRNARAHALHGFILSGENQIEAARAFEKPSNSMARSAMAGSGFSGLTKIKRGDLAGGRARFRRPPPSNQRCPFSTATSARLSAWREATRRSPQGSRPGQAARSERSDPVALLGARTSAEQPDRCAIADLEDRIRITTNRRVYRSQSLLDQDRAVRSANLPKSIRTPA